MGVNAGLCWGGHARKDQGGRSLKKSGLEAAAKVHAGRALSKASETAYEALWSGFEAWCYDFGVQAPPASPDTVAQYLTDQAATDHKAATLDSILAAIQHHHRVAGLSSPHGHPDVQAGPLGDPAGARDRPAPGSSRCWWTSSSAS